MAKPLLNIHCNTEPECEYPTEVFINMDDGTIQKYVLKYDQHPNFTEAMDALERMFDCVKVTGYQYNDRPRRKNRIHRCDR